MIGVSITMIRDYQLPQGLVTLDSSSLHANPALIRTFTTAAPYRPGSFRTVAYYPRVPWGVSYDDPRVLAATSASQSLKDWLVGAYPEMRIVWFGAYPDRHDREVHVGIDVATGTDATVIPTRWRNFKVRVRKVRPPHDMISMRSLDRRDVLIDARIAPLIAALWRVGIRTKYSCEGTGITRAYIMVYRESARAFRHVLAGFGPLEWDDGLSGDVVRFAPDMIEALTEHVRKQAAS